jgi:hypothetical protein
MSLKDEFRKMVNELTTRFTLPPIANIFFPPFYNASALYSCLMKKRRNTLLYNRRLLSRKTRGNLRLNLAMTTLLKR